MNPTRTPLRQALLAAAVAATIAALPGCFGENEADLLKSAQGFIDKKDYKAAIIQLKTVLQSNGVSAEGRLLLGQALLKAGDPVAAAVELQKARELQVADERVLPDLARSMVLIGEHAKVLSQFADTQLKDDTAMADLLTSLATARLLNNEPDNAKEVLGRALAIKPDFANAVVLQARMKAADSDIEGALKLADSVLARTPNDAGAGTLKGDLLRLGKNDNEGALAAYRKVLETQPDAVGAHAAVMTILMGSERIEDGRKQHAEMKKAAPNHPETLFFEAQLAFADKDYKRTREIADRILKNYPDNIRVLELAGAADFRAGAFLQAEAMLTRVLKLAPKQMLSRQLLAQTYLRLGMPEKTLELMQPLVDAKQLDAGSLALMGEAYLQQGDAKRSEAAFKAAEKIAPDNARVKTSVALAQLRRGDGPQAMAALEGIAAGDTGTRADLALIAARMRANDAPGALKAIDALEKKTPDKPVAHDLRARALLMQKDTAGATASFEKALAKDPQFFPSVAGLASMDLEAKRPEKARERFEALVKANPANHHARLALAELAARTGAAPADVARLIGEAVKANPNEPRPHLLLVNQYLSDGDAKSALTAAQAAVAALPNSHELLDALGRAQLASGDAQQAISTFRKLVSLQPNKAEHLVRLADALVVSKDTAEARRSLNRALELKPELVPARRALAQLALMDNKPQEALQLARDLQKKQPTDATGFALEGDIEAARKNWDSAIAAYRNAQQRSATTDTTVRLHGAYLRSNRAADADKLAQEWLRTRPRDIVFQYYLGDLAMGRGAYADAESHYRSVMQVAPAHAMAMNNVAWIMAKQGKPGAVELASRANELAPNRPALLDTLATAYAGENKFPQAIEAQKKAIALASKDPSLKLNLARIYLKAGEKPYARAELEELAALGEKFGDHAEVKTLLAQAK
jgi:putative PEP-CTERM system TPR-repeat lipoprotein